jgi:hypothetical protein
MSRGNHHLNRPDPAFGVEIELQNHFALKPLADRLFWIDRLDRANQLGSLGERRLWDRSFCESRAAR